MEHMPDVRCLYLGQIKNLGSGLSLLPGFSVPRFQQVFSPQNLGSGRFILYLIPPSILTYIPVPGTGGDSTLPPIVIVVVIHGKVIPKGRVPQVFSAKKPGSGDGRRFQDYFLGLVSIF